MQLSHILWPAKKSETSKFVLLHGMGGTGALWRPIAASLEDHHSLLAPDQRGHGGSQIEEKTSYSPIDFGNDVVETMQKIGFSPAWLVGHSMGVRTACAVAHLKPEWVEGLVLVDLGLTGPAGGGLGENLAKFLEKLPERFPTREEARVWMHQNCPDPSIVQYLLAVSKVENQEVFFPFDKNALLQTISAVHGFSIQPWIREFAQNGKPVLILRGAESKVWDKETFLRDKASLSDTPSVVFEEFPGAGHGLPFEKRKQFTALLETLALKFKLI